jgi:hypothetical protein
MRDRAAATRCDEALASLAIPAFLAQARENLTGNARDHLWMTGIAGRPKGRNLFKVMKSRRGTHGFPPISQIDRDGTARIDSSPPRVSARRAL